LFSIDNQVVKQIGQLQNLEHLEWDIEQKVTATDFSPLANLTRLRNMEGLAVYAMTPKNIVHCCKMPLTQIAYFHYHHKKPPGQLYFQDLAKLTGAYTTLHSLRLSDHLIPTYGPLQHFTNLRALFLMQGCISADAFKSMCSSHSKLEVLDLDNVHFTAKHGQELDWGLLGNLTQMTRLGMSHIHMANDDGLARALQKMTKLCVFRTHFVNFGVPVVQSLALHKTTLTRVCIRAAMITPQDLDLLSHVKDVNFLAS
jgi:hypothetical protein